MHQFGLVLLSITIAASAAPSSTSNKPSCQEVNIPVKAIAPNLQLPSSILTSLADPDALEQIVSSAANVTRGGEYNINGLYCEPSSPIAGRDKTLQILVHGNTYTKEYWTGLAAPNTKPGQDEYSWVNYATSQGYATLSIDRLCNGKSSKPNGLDDCQVPLQAESMHQIILLARNGNFPQVKSKKFEKIIFVGHSFGSVIGNALSNIRPNDVDAYLLTGFTGKITAGAAGTLAHSGYQPYAIVRPTEAILPRDLVYLIATNKDGVRLEFYHGDYDEELFEYDYQHRGTLTAGEAATIQLGQISALSYTGHIYVLNGNEDAIFCQSNPVDAVAGVPGNCSAGFSSSVRDMYPSVDISKFGYYDIANTGHCLNTHHTAGTAFRKAHDWLSTMGY